MQGQTKITNAFQLGLLGGLGVLTAILIGGAVETLANIITYVAAAIFIALGLDPVVTKLESFNLKRPVAILVVVLVLLGGLATLFWAILPTLASQGAHFIATAPAVIAGFGELPLVVRLDNQHARHFGVERDAAQRFAFGDEVFGLILGRGGVGLRDGLARNGGLGGLRLA